MQTEQHSHLGGCQQSRMAPIARQSLATESQEVLAGCRKPLVPDGTPIAEAIAATRGSYCPISRSQLLQGSRIVASAERLPNRLEGACRPDVACRRGSLEEPDRTRLAFEGDALRPSRLWIASAIGKVSEWPCPILGGGGGASRRCVPRRSLGTRSSCAQRLCVFAPLREACALAVSP